METLTKKDYVTLPLPIDSYALYPLQLELDSWFGRLYVEAI